MLLLGTGAAVTLRLFEDEDGLFDTGTDSTPRLYLALPGDDEGAGGEADE